MKEFPISAADGLCLEDEEQGENTKVSQLSLLSGRVNEAKFTEEEQTGGRTDFFIWAEGRKENFKFYLNILNYIMPT